MRLRKHLKRWHVIPVFTLQLTTLAFFGHAYSDDQSAKQNIDIFYADSQYTQQNYAEALAAYQAATKVGNPHAYYQLGKMYLNGFGTQASIIDSIAYYALAAEQDFHNADKILQSIIELMPADSQETLVAFIDDTKNKHNYAAIRAQYFPVLRPEQASIKVTFDERSEVTTVFYPDDFDWEALDNGGTPSFDDDDFEDNFDDPFSTLMTSQQTPFLIVDHEIHFDGSVRDVREVQKYGLYQSLRDNFTLFPLAKPTFKDIPTEFVSRSFLGAASYDKFTLLRENENMYRTITKLKSEFSLSNSLNDQFNLAMLLLNFPWLSSETEDAESILLALAKQGHSPAMYEYGLKLYREQRDIPTAIDWIAEASKYGLTRAEYRLGKLLQSSPWVVKDESKALFWYQSALNKGDVAARIRATELLLNARDATLHNLDMAITQLNLLLEQAPNYPEVYYLQALSYRKGTRRDISQVVENLETAIFKAQLLNWDTSEWQSLLSQITQGNVTVRDEN